ncbi:response regulator transcription factor [Novosphingobium cyanobacteriorum]|uniref:Response regulator transcription factor n=1 Tax=Novosphingobium cyanobacteriorum TaxID=3024215 RepID=A0ABT6CI12_9SPHN|nr:response regulator transcription factor [Novosphingobium cyanobacteriorum]MDF8333561.1 response regulator transcription factor [Novosphingobium cyanobacteriorum]
MNILVVEDDPGIRDVLKRGLSDEGHAVTTAMNACTALAAARSGAHDLLLLDLGLPDSDGLSLTRTLRAQGFETPIIMLTARDAVEDRIAGLRQGADDYLVKPFAFGELLARIDAVLRRGAPAHQPAPLPDTVVLDRLAIDYMRKVVTVGDAIVPLTVKELDVLRLLAAEPLRIFSRHEILQRVWGLNEDPLTNIVEVYISRLRRKLRAAGLEAIDNVRGFGYRYEVGD